MRNLICGVVLFGLSSTVAAQDATIKTETTVKADDGKAVTLSGCVSTGEYSHFILSNTPAVTGKTERAVGTAGLGHYVLVAREGVDLSSHVGHKVEVIGVIVPAATKHDKDEKIEITDKVAVEREKAPDTKSNVKTVLKVERAPIPQLLVASVRTLTSTCVP